MTTSTAAVAAGAEALRKESRKLFEEEFIKSRVRPVKKRWDEVLEEKPAKQIDKASVEEKEEEKKDNRKEKEKYAKKSSIKAAATTAAVERKEETSEQKAARLLEEQKLVLDADEENTRDLFGTCAFPAVGVATAH